MNSSKLIGILCFGIIGISLYSCSQEEIILHGEISGTVTDALTKQPLQEAKVKLVPSNDSINTGNDGKYLFKSLAPGNYQIQVSKQNYAEGINSVTVTSTNISDIDFELDAIPVIHYSKTSLDFGFYSTTSYFAISKTGPGEVAYIFSPDQAWITVNPRSGDINNETDTIRVTINREGLIEKVIQESIIVRTTYLQYDFLDKIDIYVGVHKIIFSPDLIYGTVADIEGNVYKTIVIGTQVWMAENLKTTKYNDNKPIPEVTDKITWQNLKTHGYCWYNNDSTSYRAISGAMYNGYTVNAGKLCPTGWHIPSNDEWNTLATFIGGKAGGGRKLKETGTIHWKDESVGTNEYGFTAIPSGWLSSLGYFSKIENSVDWWTTTEYDANDLRNIGISTETGMNDLYSFHLKKTSGASIRCIKDK